MMFIGDPAESLKLRDAGLDVVPEAAGAVQGAVWDQAMHDNPFARSMRALTRFGEYGGAAMPEAATAIPLDALSPTLSAEDANKRYKLPGLTPFSAPIPETVAEEIYKAHQNKLARQAIVDRREDGLLTGQAAQFGTALLAGMTDPLNVASAFIPIVPGARVAAALAGASGAMGRASIRVGVGAVEGAAGAALIEPLIYATDQQEHNDWTMGNAALNIVLGAAMGGVLHTGVGSVSDWRAAAADRARAAEMAKLAPETRELMASSTTAAILEDRPVRADETRFAAELGRSAERLETRAAAVGAMEADAPRVAEVRSLGDQFRDLPGLRAEGRPVSLLEFIGQKGGVREDGGDLRAIGADTHFVPGTGRIVRKSGMALDYAREAAEEAGYIPRGSTIADFLDAVAEEVAGRRVYLGNDIAAVHERKLASLADREQERVAEYRSAILQLSDDYGIRINDAELEHAMVLTAHGMHPDQAIRAATIGAEFRATGFLDEAKTEADNLARLIEADEASVGTRISSVAREIEAIRKAMEPSEGSSAGQLAQLEKMQSELDAIVKAERDGGRISPEQERIIQEFDEAAKIAEGDAKATEAAGYCAAMRG